MEKRLIVAIVLSFLVLMGYQYFFVKPNKPVEPAAVTTVPPAPLPGAAAALETQKQAPAEARPVQAEPAPAQDPAAVAGRAEQDVVVETPLYRAVWTNKGGVLKSWKLKAHKNSQKEDLELVPALAAEIGRYPFSLGLDDPALASLVNTALFTGLPSGRKRPTVSAAAVTPWTRTSGSGRTASRSRPRSSGGRASATPPPPR